MQTKTKSILLLAIAAISYMVFAVLYGIVGGVFLGLYSGNTNNMEDIVLVIGEGLAKITFLVTVFFMYKPKGILKGFSQFKTISLNGNMLLGLIIIIFFILHIPKPTATEPDVLYTGFLAVPYFFVLCLLGPVAEEIFYRKIFIDVLRKNFALNPLVLVVIQAVVFTLLHIVSFYDNTILMLVPFLTGLIAGCMYIYSDTIIYGLLLHIAHNSGIFFNLRGIFDKIHVSGRATDLIIYSGLGLSFVCLVLFIFEARKRRFPLRPHDEPSCATTSNPV
jgi:membrane protease YdiL (CAAX protease family)